MRFIVDRTSISGCKQPCPEALLERVVEIDKRNLDSPDKLPNQGLWWYKYGNNHRVEGGKICRDIHLDRWVINIESLDDLAKFVREHGQIIISDRSYTELEIEIYDDYRE